MPGKKPVSSSFHLTLSAEEIGRFFARMQATGADIVKIETTATEIVDVSRIF
jgi:3-dehydroquinate dehydratase/shikimate dehydrogenase